MNLAGKKETYPMSVVIATLGSDVLAGTIEILNRGTTVPAEILICIPELESTWVKKLSFDNVRVIETPCRGQVAQRAYGLQRVRHPLVMQMDDDIVLQPEDLRKLVETISQIGHGNAIAPLYRHSNSGKSITSIKPGLSGWQENMLAWLVCGAPWGAKRMGVIAPAGVGYGVDEMHCGRNPVETQWLPGGCVLCHKEDLISEDYYPFSGKAYTEDLVHSVLWRKRGVRLWVLPTAWCMTTVADMPFRFDSLKEQMKAHEYVTRLLGGKIWRLRFWYIVLVSIQIVKTIYHVLSRKNCYKQKYPGGI